MGWLERLREGAEWAEQMWEDLPAHTRARVIDTIDDAYARLFDPWYMAGLAIDEISARLTEMQRRGAEYLRDPERLRREFIDSMMPDTRYGEMARLLRPGSEPRDGFGEEISRPVILVPGMVGTRLFRSGESAAPVSGSLPPDQLVQWLERELRSDESRLLRDLTPAQRNFLRPALMRISDRRLYNPNVIWDPDSLVSLIVLMNKTATERGRLFCPEDTPGAPASDFAASVADSMSLRGYMGMLFGRDAERLARDMAYAFNVADPADVLEDARYEALRERRRLRGWCQPVWDISQHWLLPLERAFNEVVYAFGYDWRAPLIDSAELLVRKIENVKRRHGKSPILVTHSFGGLVARAAARQRPENVAGIVQIFSPTAGSVKMYTNFKKGGGGSIPPGWQSEQAVDQATLEDFGNSDVLTSLLKFDPMDMGFAMFLGWDANAFAATSAGVYGAYSLLPSNISRFGTSAHWLNIENDPALAARLRSTPNVYDLYRQFDRPWGLLDGNVWAEGQTVSTGDESERAWAWLGEQEGTVGSVTRFLHSQQTSGLLRLFTRETLDASQVRRVRERVNHGIGQAERLSARIGDYVHPNTWSFYSTGLYTDVGFNIRRTDAPAEPYATHRIVSTEGDGSLELGSARALSSSMHNELHLREANHAHVMKTPAARSALVKAVYLAMIAAHRAG